MRKKIFRSVLFSVSIFLISYVTCHGGQASKTAMPPICDSGPYPVVCDRADFSLNLKPKEMAGSFRHAYEIFPSVIVRRGETASPLPYATQLSEDVSFPAVQELVDATYEFEGKKYSLSEYMKRNDTTGFLVLKGGKIVYEEYFWGATENSLFNSFSVGKSITSTLVGLAIEDGYIKSVNYKILKYMPHYKGSGYEDVTIKQALQMSSGIKWTEDYSLGKSELTRLLNNGTVYRTESFSDIMTSVESGKYPPGTKFNYASGTSSVLSELVTTVTGMPASKYLSEKVWSKIGMEHDAYWWTDIDGMVFGTGSLSISLRDYARFGLLFLNYGKFGDQQILSEDWVKEATIPDTPQVQPGALYEGVPFLGYQYQWWTLKGDEGEAHPPYSAEGIHGQFIYVHPAEDLVIVKTSIWPTAWPYEKEAETRAVFESITKVLHNILN